MRRRVLVLNQFALPHSAAGGTRHVELFSGLRNWDATIIAGNRHMFTRERLNGAADTLYHPVWVSPYKDNGAARVLSWISYTMTAFIASQRIGRADIVYASSPHLLSGLLGLVLARLWRVPLILEVRDLWPETIVSAGVLRENSWFHRLLVAMERLLYRHADGIVVVTDAWKDHIISMGGTAERIECIPNGVDTAKFSLTISRRDREEWRRHWDLHGFVAVYAGAHGHLNGLDLLLDAAKELVLTDEHVRFLLVGDGLEKERLRARVEAEGLRNVTFLEPIPKREVPSLLHAADVGLHVLNPLSVFLKGMSPNKLYDYMACALPVLTNVEGEAAHLVESAGAGVAVSPTGIADGVRQILSAEPSQRLRWSTNGREFIERHRSRPVLARQLESFLEQCLTKAPRRSRRSSSH